MVFWADPDFSKEVDGIDKIWRYIDFRKYADLLNKKKQYFTSGKKLLELDEYEGYFKKPVILNPENWTDWEKSLVKNRDDYERNETPKSFYVNCWHINEKESARMWEGKEIAIQTTLKKIRDSFSAYSQMVSHRRIAYVNDIENSVSVPWAVHRYSKKQKKLSYENELRFYVSSPNPNLVCLVDGDRAYVYNPVPQGQRLDLEFTDEFCYVDVDLHNFIENVFVSSKHSDEFFESVKTITKENGLNPNIVKKSTIIY
ncbi:MAG: hypothetical protein KGI28_03795 [Thaumarchaeota archaeon]|nr:hypothetical protein [Nitrososphaerota archaeon]